MTIRSDSYTANQPLMRGTHVHPWGEIAAVGSIQGERYYWFTKGNGVSMMPGFMVEEAHHAQRASLYATENRDAAQKE